MTSLHSIPTRGQHCTPDIVCPPWCSTSHDSDDSDEVVHVSAEFEIALDGDSVDAARISILVDETSEPLIVAALRGRDTGHFGGCLELPASSTAAFAAALQFAVAQAGMVARR